MRQQFLNPIRPIRWQSGQDIFQIGMRIMPIHTRRLDQAHYRSRALLGKALHYMIGQWSKLKLYVTAGEYPIDNNVYETAHL